MKCIVRLSWVLLALVLDLVSSAKIHIGEGPIDIVATAKLILSGTFHGEEMGILHQECDDGIHGIDIDWHKSTEETVCYYENVINDDLPAFEITDDSNQASMHECLHTPIEYPTDLPLSGKHRPLWPKFGEYIYLPPQRWVHSLEHGAIALLYHPCKTDASDLEALKTLVRTCLGKYVITPYRKIPRHMPYALLAYKHALVVGQFDPLSKRRVTIVNFIKKYALEAPEKDVLKDGQYSHGLIESASKYSELNTTKETLCASRNESNTR